MKKLVFILFLAVSVGCLFMGCSKENASTEQTVSIRTYVFQESEEVSKPSVTLEENNQAAFMYSVLSSYYARGTYEVEKDTLTLKTDDEKNVYIFKIKDDTLIFNAEKSSAIPSFASVPDGAVFE